MSAQPSPAPRQGVRVQAATAVRTVAESGVSAVASSVALVAAGALTAVFPSAPAHVVARTERTD